MNPLQTIESFHQLTFVVFMGGVIFVFLTGVSVFLMPSKQQGGHKPKGPLEALRPKLQVSLG